MLWLRAISRQEVYKARPRDPVTLLIHDISWNSRSRGLVPCVCRASRDSRRRIRHHLENQERLEPAADKARIVSALRRASVQDVRRIEAYAKELGEFLMERKVTETRAFVRSSLQKIGVQPGRTVIHHAVSTLMDNDIEGADVTEVVLSRRART